MWKPQAAIAAVLVTLSGCAAIQGQTAADSEQILAQAGFARQPQTAAQGATRPDGGPLPARQLTEVANNGNTAYEFYDPRYCHCVYVGGPKELAKLQELRSTRVAEHAQNLRAFIPSAGGAPDPNLWGPWQPEGLDVK